MGYLRQIAALGLLTALGFALYLLAFAAGAASSITILFYRGVVLAGLVAVIIGITGAWLGRRLRDPSLAISAAAVSLSLNLCFLVLLPVTVDRSVTVYLLSRVEQEPSGIAPPLLERVFIDGYVRDMHAIDRRIDEQRRSGNISVGTDGKIRLTAQGRRFITLSRTVARLFGTDPRFVHASSRR